MSIEAVITRMEGVFDEVAPDNPVMLFHGTYYRTTKAVRDELRRSGFADNEWVERWDVTYAEFYLDALEVWLAGRNPAGPWQVAFDASRGVHIPPLRSVLLGMNAHINFDQPQALLSVISDDEFDDAELVAKRSADHGHIDAILSSRVAAEDVELKRWELPGDRTFIDRLLTPLNRLGTKRFLREARAKTWRNARLLSLARRQGPDALAARLAELEQLSKARVIDLRKPGLVLLELTRKGFGVALSD